MKMGMNLFSVSYSTQVHKNFTFQEKEEKGGRAVRGRELCFSCLRLTRVVTRLTDTELMPIQTDTSSHITSRQHLSPQHWKSVLEILNNLWGIGTELSYWPASL